MQEEKFSPQESLSLIQSMINRTTRQMSTKTHYYLVWGWLTFTACIGQFLLKHVMKYDKHYLVWLLVVVGAVYSIVMGIRESKNEKVKTYIGESLRYLWTGMGLTYLVMSIVLSKIGWGTSVFPFFIILYGLGTFVSGSFLRFSPLIIGGTIAWVLAVVAVYLAYDYQILVAALAILVSYIIPAYILRSRNSKV